MDKSVYLQLQYQNLDDIYLKSSDNYNLFNYVMPSYQNFSLYDIEIPLDCDFGETIESIRLDKEFTGYGDYLHTIFLKTRLKYTSTMKDTSDTTVPNKYGKWSLINDIGFSLIKKIELLIDHTVIDSLDNKYLSIWKNLCTNLDKHNIDSIINNNKLLEYDIHKDGYFDLFIPIPLFFFENFKQALPISAIINKIIELRLEFEEKDNLINKQDYYYKFDTIGESTLDTIKKQTYDINIKLTNTFLQLKYILIEKFNVKTNYDILFKQHIYSSKTFVNNNSLNFNCDLNNLINTQVNDIVCCCRLDIFSPNTDNKALYTTDNYLYNAAKRFCLRYARSTNGILYDDANEILYKSKILCKVKTLSDYSVVNFSNEHFIIDIFKKLKPILIKSEKKNLPNARFDNIEITNLSNLTFQDRFILSLPTIHLDRFLAKNELQYNDLSHEKIWNDSDYAISDYNNEGSWVYDIKIYNNNLYTLLLNDEFKLLQNAYIKINNIKKNTNTNWTKLDLFQYHRFSNNNLNLYSFSLNSFQYNKLSGFLDLTDIDSILFEIDLNQDFKYKKLDNEIKNYYIKMINNHSIVYIYPTIWNRLLIDNNNNRNTVRLIN
tara:strand:+ start:420 stop:2231 length:1812 start_codon:yes stop_codon:yes gene_type:complete